MTRHAIRDARYARGWTQSDLAARAETKQMVVSRLETGKPIPEPVRLRITAALGLDTATGGE